jgi:PST family polysaccharide transporter
LSGEAGGRALPWAALQALLLTVGQPLLVIACSPWVSPRDLGLAALAGLAPTLAVALLSAGPAQELVRLEEGAWRRVASPLFWWGLAAGVGLWALLWLAAPAAADLVRAPEAVPVLQVSGARLPLAMAAAIPFAIAQRGLMFRATARPLLVAAFAPLAVALPLAWSGAGHWAVVIGGVVAEAARAIALASVVPWRPGREASWALLRPHARFGTLQLAHSLQAWIANQADRAIVAVLLGLEALGYYSLGFSACGYLAGLAAEPVARLAYPVLARVRGHAAALREAYLGALATGATAAFFFGLAPAALGPGLVDALLPARWAPLGLVLAGLGLHFAAWSALRVNQELFKALGRPEIAPRQLAVALAVSVPLWVAAAPLGLAAFVVARAATVLPLWWLQGRQVARLLELPAVARRAALAGPLAASAAMLAVGLGGDVLVRLQGSSWPALAAVVAGPLAFVAVLRGGWPELLRAPGWARLRPEAVAEELRPAEREHQ